VRPNVRAFFAIGLAAVLADAACAQTKVETGIACQALIHARGLSAPLLGAYLGDAKEFPVFERRLGLLTRSLTALASTSFQSAEPLPSRIRGNGDLFLNGRETLLQVHGAVHALSQQAGELLNSTEEVALEELKAASPPARINASSQLAMLSQRIGKSASELISIRGLEPEAVFLLNKDVGVFQEIATGLRDGNPELRLRPAATPAMRERLSRLLKQFDATRESADTIRSSIKSIVAARESEAYLLADLTSIEAGLEQICPYAQ
jgi:twitching motility protein PilJ